MTQKIFLSLVLFLSSCAQFQTKNFRTPAQVNPSNQCATSAGNPPLFTVLENTSEKIKVNLNNFAEVFEVVDGTYDVHVTFTDTSTKDFQYKGIPTILDVHSEKKVSEPATIEIPVTQSGVYLFELSKDNKVFWKQKVFSINKNENTLTAEEKSNLAKKYAPVLQMHKDERYFPTSFDYIFNKIDTDSDLAEEPFYITNRSFLAKTPGAGFFSLFKSKTAKTDFSAEFLFKDVEKVLPYYGHFESVLKSGLEDSTQTKLKLRYGKEHLTVYYSVFENKKWNEIYLNYHFFYAYDPKNGTANKDVMPAHIFDRESVTVVLRGTSRQPLYAFYGAHLPNQMMAQLDAQNKIVQSWLTGRVFVNWPDTIQENGRLQAVAALGSHGIYPIQGNYGVMLNENISLLLEPAGGGAKLYPNFDPNAGDNPKYDLRSLALENVTSDCKTSPLNMLAYSGSTVDVLGPTNATFPPFTDREADFKNYLDPNAPLFDMKKAAEVKY